jgi:hypothetical protein
VGVAVVGEDDVDLESILTDQLKKLSPSAGAPALLVLLASGGVLEGKVIGRLPATSEAVSPSSTTAA